MSRAALAVALLFLAGPGSAAEKYAVIAVGDPPNGPDGDLTELAYQLRAACRDRVPNVQDPQTMRAKLLGQTSGATESELDRAYGGALAVFQNGEFESAMRTLAAIIDDLESLPESEEAYFQWKRAMMRLAHAAFVTKHEKEVERAFGTLARMEPGLQPDPDQFSPNYRKRFEEVKARVRALPKRKLTITSDEVPGSAYVNGKLMGKTPVTVTLPTGTYRVGGASGSLRVPRFEVELGQEDRTVVLDFPLAAALRLNGGPGLALGSSRRAWGIIQAGAWLGVDKLVVVTRSQEGQAQFLVGGIYDVMRGALLREGSVRMVAGGVPSVNLSALAAFLLTGQSSREVKDLSHEKPRRVVPTPVASVEPGAWAGGGASAVTQSAPSSPPVASTSSVPRQSRSEGSRTPALSLATSPQIPGAPPDAGSPNTRAQLDPKLAIAAPDPSPLQPPPGEGGSPQPSGRAWMGPTAIGAGVLAVGLAALAIQQKNASDQAYSKARDQLRSDGSFKDPAAQARWSSLRDEGSAKRRNATISGGAAIGATVTAAILGWNAWRAKPERMAMLVLEF